MAGILVFEQARVESRYDFVVCRRFSTNGPFFVQACGMTDREAEPKQPSDSYPCRKMVLPGCATTNFAEIMAKSGNTATTPAAASSGKVTPSTSTPSKAVLPS
jgi:hypothetical protein